MSALNSSRASVKETFFNDTYGMYGLICTKSIEMVMRRLGRRGAARAALQHRQKVRRSCPWKERSPFLPVLTPNVLAANDGVLGVGWLRTFVESKQTWTLFDSLTRKFLLALMSRLQFPK